MIRRDDIVLNPPEVVPKALIEFSRGRVSVRRAMESLGLRDNAQLLLALGENGLEPPPLPPHQIAAMQSTFVRLLREAGRDRSLHARHS
jgi:hypothetical protein